MTLPCLDLDYEDAPDTEIDHHPWRGEIEDAPDTLREGTGRGEVDR